MTTLPSNRVVVPENNRRDLIIAVVTGLLVLVVIVYGILNLSTNSGNSTIQGRIVEKKFLPQKEQQITIGSGGVQQNDQKGTYVLKVRSDKDGEIYNVWLDEETYNSLHTGDAYQIPQAAIDPN